MDGPWPTQRPIPKSEGNPATRRRGRPCWPTRSATRANCAGCWTCRRGRPAPEGRFPLLVPRPYVARIRRADPRDPLLLQILPRPEESIATPRFSADPLGESAARRGPGLLGKYPGRSLIVTTGVCAVHCRFCFRRHFPYPTPDAEPEAVDQALAHVAADTSLGEVILSGGDPLTLTDCRLAELAQRLARIGHLRRLRVHTRMPIVIPQRVTPELIAWLRGTRLTPIMVVHVNHPAEIDPAVADALGRLVDAGVAVLSQTVLLAGGERSGGRPGRVVPAAGRSSGDAVLSSPVGPSCRRRPF